MRFGWACLCLAARLAAQDIVVTGTYEPVPLQESDRSIELHPVVPLLAGSLADFFKLDSSVDLRQRSPNDIQADVSIRGGSFGQTLVLLNGMRLNDVQSGHHNLDLPIPLAAVDRIEILEGSGSTLYGSDAVAGVINLVTREPQSMDFRLRAGVGNFGVNQESGAVELAGSHWGEELDFARDFSTGFAPDRDYRNLSLSSLSHLKTGWGATDVTLALSDRPFGADRFYGKYNSWERTKGWFGGLHQQLGKQTEVNFAFRRHTDLFVLYRDRPQVFTNRHAVDGEQFSVRRWERLGGNTRLHYGLEGLHDSIGSNNLGRHRRTRGAGFAALDIRALKRFSFSIGGREEVYGGGRSQFSPAITAGAWLLPKLKVHGAATHAFRLPSYTDLYYHDPGNVGSPNLRPEKAWTYEAGLEYAATRTVSARVTVFERRERDVIDYTRTSPDDLWRATNFERLNFTGVEAGVHTVIRGQQLDVSYTALHGQAGTAASVLSKYVANYPSHEAVAGWQANLRGAVLMRSRLGVVQRIARSPYAVWDLYAAGVRGRVHPFVQFTNLTSTVYQEITGVRMPPMGVVGGVEIGFRGK